MFLIMAGTADSVPSTSSFLDGIKLSYVKWMKNSWHSLLGAFFSKLFFILTIKNNPSSCTSDALQINFEYWNLAKIVWNI